MIPFVDPARYAAYIAISAVMVVTPGPANLFAIAVGALKGHRAVLAAVLGMNLANLVWYAAAALGLAAVASAWPALFHLLAYAGAAYLAWLGLRAIFTRPDPALDPENHAEAVIHPARSALRDGFMVQIANPKALIFVTAILPPFIEPTRSVLGQIAVLAATCTAMDVAAMTAYGFGGAVLATRMREPRFRRGFAIFTGLLLLSAALMVVVRES